MTEKRQPWLRFYTADWRGDAGLRAVGYAARGLWIDMLSLMHEATPYGHLVLNGKPLDAARLASRLGGSAKEVQQLLDRLELEGVFSRTDDGAIYSRRMVADAAKAERDRLNGRTGGNPRITAKAEDKAEDNGEDGGGENGGVNPEDKAHARTCAPVPLPVPEKKEGRSLRSLVRSKAAQADPIFAEFYAAYPRHEASDDALKAWRSVLSAGALPADVMAGLARHRFNPDPQFVPLPATWLRAGRWKDEPSTALAAVGNATERRIRERDEAIRRMVEGDPFIDHEPSLFPAIGNA